MQKEIRQQDGDLLCSGSAVSGTMDGGQADGVQGVSLRFTILKAGKVDLTFKASRLPFREGKSYALLTDGGYLQTTADVKSPSESGDGKIKGDVNGDGTVNLQDIIKLLNIVTEE